jgi:hypothetical protein
MAPPVFPSVPGITFPVKRFPHWTGTRHDALSGKRVRTTYMTYPTYDYEVGFSFLRTAAAFTEWQTMVGFINQLNGSQGLFLYNDVDDNTATQASFGTGDGVTTGFQLTRPLGGFTEPVFFPDTPIPTVRVGGSATSAYTVGTLGVINFTSAPALGAALDWTGTFKWPCRLDLDQFGLEKFASGLYELKVLKFSTEKLP